MLATAVALTRGWSVQDTTDSERQWVRKARAWLLKVALANTAGPLLGPCARCGGVDLYRVTRAGARMCLACTRSSEVIAVDTDDLHPSQARLPRREPNIRDRIQNAGSGSSQTTSVPLESPSPQETLLTSNVIPRQGGMANTLPADGSSGDRTVVEEEMILERMVSGTSRTSTSGIAQQAAAKVAVGADAATRAMSGVIFALPVEPP
jgi:hypothetical protein